MSDEQTGDEVVIEDPKAVLEALERAKADAKKYRELSAELEKTKEDLQAHITELESNDTLWKDRAVSQSVRAELTKQGVNADRVMKFMDLNGVTFDNDGNITGVSDSLNKVKTELPELFDTKRQVGGVADFGHRDNPKPNKSTTELQVARLFH